MPNKHHRKSSFPFWLTNTHSKFLLLWPLINIIVIVLVLFSIDVPILNYYVYGFLTDVVIMIWGMFIIFWGLVQLSEHYLIPKIYCNHMLIKGVLYISCILFSFYLARNLFPSVFTQYNDGIVFTGSINLSLQVIIYLIIKKVANLRERELHIQMMAKQKEIQMLRSQNNPHFLINTLNLIVTQIDEKPDNAKALIYDLSDLLRATLQLSEKSLILLTQELHIVERYLILQKNRFEERFSYQIKNQLNDDSIMLPALLLLPLIENAIKHAVAPYKHNNHIELSITPIADQQKMFIQISDHGISFDSKNIIKGNGLILLEKTLHLFYDDKAHYHLSHTGKQGLITLTLPLKTKEN